MSSLSSLDHASAAACFGVGGGGDGELALPVDLIVGGGGVDAPDLLRDFLVGFDDLLVDFGDLFRDGELESDIMSTLSMSNWCLLLDSNTNGDFGKISL